MTQVRGIGREDSVRSGGFGVNNSVWLTLVAGSFRDAVGLPCNAVVDASVLDASVLKVGELVTWSDVVRYSRRGGLTCQDTTSCQVTTLTLDTVSPTLDKFILEHETKQLHLFFSEAVSVASLQVSSFHFIIYADLTTQKLTLATAWPLTRTPTAHIILDLGTSWSVPSATPPVLCREVWSRAETAVGLSCAWQELDHGDRLREVRRHRGELRYVPALPSRRGGCSCRPGTYPQHPRPHFPLPASQRGPPR